MTRFTSLKRRPGLFVYSGFVFFLLYAPLVILSVRSLNLDAVSNAPVSGGIFYWYEKAFTDVQWLKALKNSLVIGFFSMILSTTLGTLAAIGLHRHNFKWKVFFESLLNLPLVLPEIVMGLSLLVWFSFLNITLGLFSVTLAHTTFAFSYVTMIVLARMQGMDPLLEEAASDLGGTPWKIFWKITFPLLLPAIISGALLAFTLSFDDFLITFFTSGVDSDTLPVRIYSMLRFGITPEMNAVNTAVLFLTLLVVFIMFKLKKA